jgi:hypothetical protein
MQKYAFAWTHICGLLLLTSVSHTHAQEVERNSPLCQRLTLKDIESMPGWGKLKKHVQQDLGVPIETVSLSHLFTHS